MLAPTEHRATSERAGGLRIGLVGAGPWAQKFTAPMLAGSSHVQFMGIWARRAEAAAKLAAAHGVVAFTELDELFATCDACTFSVPPSVQASLAARAAGAGLAVLLDKPIGVTLAEAEALTEAIEGAGVVSQLLLTNRYRDDMRDFLAAAQSFAAYGGRASFFGDGAVPGTYYGTPWRVAEGGLLDLGPHVLDALDAALGPIVEIEGRGDPRRLVLLECAHADGRLSQAALSANSHQDGGLRVELHGLDGRLVFDAAAGDPAAAPAAALVTRARIVEEFVEAVRHGRSPELDVQRGLHLQRLLSRAAAGLRT